MVPVTWSSGNSTDTVTDLWLLTYDNGKQKVVVLNKPTKNITFSFQKKKKKAQRKRNQTTDWLPWKKRIWDTKGKNHVHLNIKTGALNTWCGLAGIARDAAKIILAVPIINLIQISDLNAVLETLAVVFYNIVADISTKNFHQQLTLSITVIHLYFSLLKKGAICTPLYQLAVRINGNLKTNLFHVIFDQK